MTDQHHDGAEADAEDTDELLYTDLNVSSSVLDLEPRPLRLDHCDLLLDAIDAQLGQLQVQPHKHQGIFRKHDCSDTAPLQWSRSLSKDTGLGSTTQTNDTPMSCLDLVQTPTMKQKFENNTSFHSCNPERNTGCRGGADTHEDTTKRFDRRSRNKEEMESRREEVIWRLERLLGDTCEEDTMPGEAHPLSDSVCTEDFVRRFDEEMVEVALPESHFQQQDKREEAERTETSDSDTRQSEQKGQSVLHFKRRGSVTLGKSSKDAVTAHYSLSNYPAPRKEVDKCLSNNFGVNTSHSEKAPQRLGDDCSLSHRAEVVTEHESKQHNRCCSPEARCLAGVPVRSFDSVSIASDLDSVGTEQVRQHIHTRPGWRSLLQSVTGVDDYLTNQTDDDTPTQEESEPQSTSVNRSSFGNCQKRKLRKTQHKKRESCRLKFSLGHNDKDTDEDISDRTSEKIQWTKMKEQLTNLRQKCENEEGTLRLKRTQLKDVELCLSELRQRRKHALQELERVTAQRAQMEKEKKTMESSLRDSRVERDSLSCQVERLQRQRDSCLHEIRDMEEELETLSQRQKTLKDGSCSKNNVIMSVLEREEMERQLDSAKTELFAEQRRAREKLESMQENLEQTREELQRATEAESSLRNRCVCLEQKQIQKKEQIEALEVQVSELQVELGECKIRVGTLEKMLAQKELQLLDFQEQQGALQAERDGLKGELQHLKSQHYKAVKEAQEQTYRLMVKQQAEEEKASALKEHTLVLTRCIDAMQSSIQLKEEEAKNLRISLEQQKEAAKNREEELLKDTSEKVNKAIEEKRRKWEAEKVEAVKVHCGILEEQNKKSQESMRSETQREKSRAQALQHKVLELKTRMQELESESCAQQREQECLLAVICKSLKEEHQAELQRLKKQMAQENQRTVLQLEKASQLAKKEADRLQVTLEERERCYNRITAELDQQQRRWAQELGAECQHVQLLVEQSGARQRAVQLPASPTVAEALTTLRALREQLEQWIIHLHQELGSQKQTTEQLRKDKERELSAQRQQLRVERDRALDSVKERLIQEHIEELSGLNRAQLTDGGAEGGAAVSLRKQLKAKDVELRQVQRSMAQWKQQTAARLACKFEEELTAELERCKAKLLRGRKTSMTRGEGQRTSERPEEGKTLSVKDAQTLVCSPSLHVVDSAASHSPSDVASFKLLRYLQSRVKQLRLENQAYTWISSPHSASLDMSESSLRAIAHGQDSAGILTQAAIRTVPS
ncbi:trichohyalin isoform X2 [Paralichthys olivaceus]|uniref:trichohyalin isoform X2 n=1 Tax=Paralichthys olivaceus TaxID=8255 RepID=UPI00374FF3CE